ncbi:MAG: ribonuclease J [bacterium]|jgi:ribonuclease J
MAGKNKKNINVIPLGGLGELGKNMLLIEYAGKILVLDAGLMLPEEEMLGIDCVIPDISYLLENRSRIQGIILSHGHEDHIGALPYILRDLPVPVYGTAFTLGLLRNKLREAKYGEQEVSLQELKVGESFSLGIFKLDIMHVNHNIPDAVAISVHTGAGIIVYTGDFKFDQTPVDGKLIDIGGLASLGDQGVLLLLAESTNAEKPGYANSERQVAKGIDKILLQAKGRVIIATYASNLHRVQQILERAQARGRKVVLLGNSLIDSVQTALQLGYFNFPQDLLVSWEELAQLPLESQLVLASGKRGNPFSILAPLAMGGERDFKINKDDIVVVAASSVRGNGKILTRIIDQLFLEGAQVIYEDNAGINASGHGQQEELKMMLNLVRPRYFVPIHGEYRQLVHHTKLAEAVGIPADNIFILENGSILELGPNSARIAGKVTAGKVLVDGLGVGDVGKVVLRDRHQLSQDGILIAVITMSKEQKKIIAGPDLISRGFVYVRESESLMDEAKEQVRQILETCAEKQITEWGTIKNKVRESLGKFLYDRTRRRPMILPIIMEI